MRSLAKPAGDALNVIRKVSLLGYSGELRWKQTAEGLEVALPAARPSPYTASLKIEGFNLVPVPVVDVVEPVKADAQGNYRLLAAAAEVHGSQLNTEERDGQSNLGFWDKPEEFATWNVRFSAPGRLRVAANCAAVEAGRELQLEVGGSRIAATVGATGGWGDFKTVDLGVVEIQQAGEQVVKLGPKDPAHWKPTNVRWVSFTKE